MNQSHISDRLWKAIASNYESGDYKGAILDGMQVITDVLREKSAVDGDGGALVGQALGGENPKIRLNALSTQTEKDFQRGFENILRGMYLAIRNPRTHEANNDERKPADAILTFIDYALSILVASSESFTIDGFIGKVADLDFVKTQRYAELIVGEIPPLHLGEALNALFENRQTFRVAERQYLIAELLGKLNESQRVAFFSRVSNEFRGTMSEIAIRTALQIISPEDWQRIDEAPRLRLEHKLINGIREGEILADGRTLQPLATWAGPFLRFFQSRSEAAMVLSVKLLDTDADDRNYVGKFFLRYMPALDESETYIERCVRAIAKAIREGDANLHEHLVECVTSFPESWTTKLVVAMEDLTDKENPAVVLKDGTPFLKAPPESSVFDDDIPF